MSQTKVIQATNADFSSFEIGVVERRPVGGYDVEIKINYCGICHSDIDAVAHGFAPYPIVPEHEITGVVTSVGDQVTKYKIGDRVGVGCFVDSCGECRFCQAGQEQFCEKGCSSRVCFT